MDGLGDDGLVVGGGVMVKGVVGGGVRELASNFSGVKISAPNYDCASLACRFDSEVGVGTEGVEGCTLRGDSGDANGKRRRKVRVSLGPGWETGDGLGQRIPVRMKPAVDEMFPEGAGPYVDLDEAGGSSGLLMDLAANEKAVHADFFNDFEDLFDDDDIQ
ncbi:hypothetical protein chiPu_0010786 [Chiloscyllium punctatum]|uniref:COP9 signalosome complex subunit 9 n=4 Tax=Gnathostomata TaxID=7776 RepID=A0A401SPJ0_CHIPU|nr:hypothetical protein [Chiloscyllium punctatum]